jgi:biotin carboxylase
MEKKKIIILGASRYYIRSIESAKEAGYFVIAVDRNPGAEGFSAADLSFACDIVDKEGMLQIAKDHGISGIIPLNDYGVLTAAYVATQLNLPGISEEVAERSSNKELMREKWLETGVLCPQLTVAETKEEFIEGIAKIGLPCILKPAHGIGGASRGVVVIRHENEIEDAITFSQQFYEDKSTLIETFIEAEVEHSAEVIIHNGVAEVIAISDKIKTPLPFRVDKNVLYPTILEGDRLERLKAAIVEAVFALGITIGAAHVELATTPNGFYLFELGARCGGGGTPSPIVPHVSGVDEFVEFVRILAGDEAINLKPTKNNASNYHFFTPKPGKIKSIEYAENIDEIEGVLDYEIFVKAGDTVPEVTVGTERSGFFIIGTKERSEALRIGELVEASIVIEYED